MKVSLKWLREYADINIDAREYADIMTNTGSMVDNIEHLGQNIKNIVAGKVISIERHQDSDHLWVCQLDVGNDAPVQVVTGAQNVTAGAMVPVCLNNAVLPSGKVIKSGKLRGVVSEGMLCSIAELELDTHYLPYAAEDGILLLQEDCTPGQDICEVLELYDTVIDFELTFNRPDCLSVIALARESAASIGSTFRYTKPVCGGAGDIGGLLSVEVQNTALCPRYTARMVKNVKVGVSPLWLRSKLRACGIRSINNIVDITNYVMLEYGQPMHAFDYDNLNSKKIVVKNAAENQFIITLDGEKRELDPSMLCITDGEAPLAIAGIMGGDNSGICETTATVVFECANFNRSSVRKTSRKLGLRTDSSMKFEKGLPACNTLDAINRACELIEALSIGEVVGGVIDICSTDISPRKIAFDSEKINALLGVNLTAAQMLDILEPLDIYPDGSDGIIVPPLRYDIESNADIAEEIVRLYGLSNIEATAFKSPVRAGGLSAKAAFFECASEIMVSLGADEIYNYSFISPKMFDKMLLPADHPAREYMKLQNPLGEDTSVMRTTAIPSLLNTASYNINRKNSDIFLFENTNVFKKRSDMPDDMTISTTQTPAHERRQLVFGFTNGDFYDLKGCAEALLDNLKIKNYKFESASFMPFHPGRCATITVDGEPVGVIGQLHPEVNDNFNVKADFYCAEIDLEALFCKTADAVQFKPLPAFPPVSRDLSLIMDADIKAGDVADAICSYIPKLIDSVEIFDVYTGINISENKKSVAYRLHLMQAEKTLTDAEIDAAVEKVLSRLFNEKEIVIRS